MTGFAGCRSEPASYLYQKCYSFLMGVLVEGFTVQETAAALDVSRIRVQHMIRDHQLVAERVGNRWIIPRHEVFRAQRIPRQGGRPFSAARCWEIIDEITQGHRSLDW